MSSKGLFSTQDIETTAEGKIQKRRSVEKHPHVASQLESTPGKEREDPLKRLIQESKSKIEGERSNLRMDRLQSHRDKYIFQRATSTH